MILFCGFYIKYLPFFSKIFADRNANPHEREEIFYICQYEAFNLKAMEQMQ
jgi:hypothetical protein